MRQVWNTLLASALALSLGACQKGEKQSEGSAAGEGAKTTETAAQAARPADDHAGHAHAETGPQPGDIPAPSDVAAPPADAQKTAGGVSYKILSPGKADGKLPGANDTVKVHYTGWTTDGKMFDSSVKRGQPATFGLQRVIPGWTDGLQVVAEGAKARLWIPEEMAYKGQPGRPQGMLVFDVEVLEVMKAPETPADVAAPPADAQKTALGVSYKVLKKGPGGKKPRAWDQVKVHYTGWTTDGKMFDSSVTRGQPAEFSLQGVIPGWADGLQQMQAGDSYRLWIPAELAYKDRPGAPQGTLVFDVELLEVTEMPEPPPVPKDVAAPPKDAKKTEKGVFYKVLAKGKGTKKPGASSKVKVHYTGWTTDGKMFDSSVTKGQPATFPLGGVIPGWTDGLQVMVEGEKTRFWIPEELAYKGQHGAPQGMLVFDVELLEIQE